MASKPLDDEPIYVDPQVVPIIERMLATLAERGPVGSATAEVMRRRFNDDVRAWNQDLPALPLVEDRVCDTGAGPIPVRLYDPAGGESELPCLIFFHGGGWIVGDLETNERTLRLLARQSGVRVLSVDYPLAPENKFPAGLDVCVAVVRWVREHGAQWGVDASRLAVGGDSAGGNLALATALDLRNAHENFLQYVLLVYAALSPEPHSPSHALFGGGDFGLGTIAMNYFWSQYLADDAQRNDPRAAPSLASMEDMPPMYLVTAGLDPLTDDSTHLADTLRELGIPVTHRHYPGVIHGFFSMSLFLEAGARAVEEAAAALRTALSVDHRR
jgi:acetyl esterase